MNISFELYLVYAYSLPRYGIGKNGKLPWPNRLDGDMNHFYDITTSTPVNTNMNGVLMGRKTYMSLPVACRPLKNRINVVVTSYNWSSKDNLYFVSSYEEAIQLFNRLCVPKVFAIGGYSCFQYIADHFLNDCSGIFVTEVFHDYESDVFLPLQLQQIPKNFVLVEKPKQIQEREICYNIYNYSAVSNLLPNYAVLPL